MEEEKAAAYYDELARKGEGAARFKRGLGFSSSSSSSSSDPFASKTSASPFSQFVRASSPGRAERQAQLASVQRKLGRSPSPDRRTRDKDSRRSSARESDNESRRRERSGRSPSRRHREEYDDEERKRRRRRRPRSSSREDERRRGRSRSPPRQREKSRPRRESSGKNKNSGVDYSLLIENYSQMTPAERVKAKMKLQLSQTAAKDTNMGMKTGWERFDFNKEAPLDEDEIEEAEDDASLVKNIGQSFRFSAVKAKHEEEVKNAHDQAMFGAPVAASPVIENQFPEEETVAEEDHKRNQSEFLISSKVLAMQQGSWRDRARKLQSGSRN